MTVAFERDADDLRLIMQHYLDAGNQDRIYSEQGDCFDLLNEPLKTFLYGFQECMSSSRPETTLT